MTDVLVLYSSRTSLWKLADFGLSVDGLSNTTKYSRGTPGYRAPELLAMEEEPAWYTNKVDIWAMGCILYELATGQRPFKSDLAVTLCVHLAWQEHPGGAGNTFNVDSTCSTSFRIYSFKVIRSSVPTRTGERSNQCRQHLNLYASGNRGNRTSSGETPEWLKSSSSPKLLKS